MFIPFFRPLGFKPGKISIKLKSTTVADVGVDPADADDPDLDYVDALVEEVRLYQN